MLTRPYETAATDPDRPAVVHGGAVTTYGELVARASAYAVGGEVGDIVAVALPRGVDLVAAALGVLASGRVFLPVDVTLPAARQAMILEDADPRAVIRTPLAPALPVSAPVTDAELAYCVYTSGSTGRPKGTLLTHAGLAVIIEAQRSVLGVSAADRVAQFAAPGFDAFMFELVMALANGATLVIVPDAVRADPEALRAFLDDDAVSVATLPSIMVTGLSRCAEPAKSPRLIASAGDVLTAEAVRRWPHPARLFNLYGPTEATIWTTAHECDPADPEPTVPIGHPIPGAGVRLVDGEILVSGTVLARGYLNRPELTAERFAMVDGVRHYRTGDLARVRADGAIEFAGRRDHQVKLRGFRVELGEVEAVLRGHPDVTDAVALVAGDHLVAHTTPEVTADLRAYAAQILPDHMVPAWVRTTAAFPVTPSGKADRAALAATEPPIPGEAPRTPTEQAVARIWCDVLGLADCGRLDTFQARGGHSLTAVRLANRITADLCARVDVIDVLRHPTVAALAELVERATPLAAVTAEPGGGPAPVSAAQAQVAYAIEVDGRADAYVARARVALRGPLDVGALAAALREITERHEIFRTRFTLRDGELVKIIEDAVEVDLPVTDAPEAEAWPGLVADVMDPATLPLVRWALVRRGPDDHVLLHAEHHYVHDGWSYRVFLDELASRYSGRTPAPAVQFAEFTRAQHAWLASPAAEAAADHWRAELADAPHPAVFPRLAVGAGPGGLLRRDLPEAALRRVDEVAAALGATPFQVMFGAFALLLSRHAGTGDLVIGSTLANRSSAAWERVIGMIVNLVPVRVRGETARTVGEYLTSARDGLFDALRWGELPLSRIIAETGVREPGVLFNAHSALTGDVEFTGLRAEVTEALANDAAKFPLNVTLIPGTARSELLLEYAPGRFGAERIDHLAAAYLDLLAGLRLDQPVEALDPLLPAQAPNAHGNTYGKPWRGGVADRFLANALRHPDAPAIVHGGTRWTYDALRRRSAAYAAHLVAAGVEPGERVALSLGRGPELVAATLGVLRVGAVYVPLDPDQPAARTAAVTADADVRIVLDTPVADAEFTADVPVGPDSPAYCGFTSGSTGRPKGVLVPHGALENVLDFFHDQAPDRFARMLALTPTTFDIANLELLLPLCHGGTVVVADREQARDGDALVDLVAAEAVTAVQATPATWRLITEAQRWPGWDRRVLALCGGEALPRELSAAIRSGVDELWNVYGPTETTIWSTWHRCTGTDTAYEPIGLPIADTAVHLLGPDGHPVTDGEVGEVHIGGAGVAIGYVNQPGLTASRFVPDPYAPTRAAMYRTGDLARRGPRGLEFLGRDDDQVKVNGHRVEPGEIESALRADPAVGDAVVVARVGAIGETSLVAFVTGSADGVRDRLGDRLPTYLVPSVVHAVDSFPLTPNGKTDRKALLAGLAATPVPAWSDSRLTRIIAEVDPACAVHPDTDFTALGLHSLALMRLAALCRREYGVDVTVADLRACGTPSALSALLATRSGTSVVSGIGPADRTRALRPSSAQERMWLLSQVDSAKAAYHVRLSYRLTGDLDTAALYAALARIVERHEVLRTGIVIDGGGPALAPLPARIGDEPADHPFDLADGPLIRAGLRAEASGDQLLTITAHHLVTDGWSNGVLLRELGALYGAFTRGEPDPLPPLPVQYVDYAAWQRERVPALTAEADFWRDTLAGAPVLAVPTDRPRPPRPDHRGAMASRVLDADLTAHLRAFGGRHGTTPFETAAASWVATLARLSGQDDVVIGTPVANRDNAAVHDLIGLFVNTVALRFDLAGDPTVAEWAARVRTAARAAQSHAELPLDHVVDIVGTPRSPAHHPLFDTVIAWEDQPARLELPGVTAVAAPPTEHTTARFDLALVLTDLGDRVEVRLEYATALFDPDTAGRYLDCWATLLHAMVTDDTVSVSDLPLLPAAERERLTAWNDTAVDFAEDRCLHEWVTAQVARVPDRVAVRHGADAITYAELNRRANQVAWRLRGLGVQPDDRVAVHLDRGIGLVVAFLGVLKAGGAYVPLDPAHPPLRSTAVLAGCEPAALIGDFPWSGPVIELSALAGEPDTDPPNLARAHHLAYVLHTSGSTGAPKGVMVEHRSVANLLSSWLRWARLPSDGFAASAWCTATFDVSVFELFAPLAAGGTVHFVPTEVRSDAGSLVTWVRDNGIAHGYLPPFAVRGYVDEPLPLRALLVGVEPLREPDLRRLMSANPGLRVANGYGPTEATVFCTTYDTIGDHDRTAPIGRPIDNTRVSVLDRHGHPVPVGVPGELTIAGACLARGYLGDDQGGFGHDRATGDRVYRTGDLARWRPDGTLEFLGRRDDQLKVRGHRVEPGGLVAMLTARPDVVEAVVTSGADALLVHYAGTAAPADLREHLAARLPAALVPTAYMRVPALPRTSAGKVDRAALPEPDHTAVARAAFTAPDGETETTIAAAWTGLLGGLKVGRDDDFFAVGGHSLLAVRLVAEVRQAFDVDFTVADVFDHPTPAAMAARVLDLDLAAFDPAALAALLGHSTQE